MSIQTKATLVIATVLNFAVCCMAFIAVEKDILPTFAVTLVPWTIAAYGVAALSFMCDLFASLFRV